MLKHMKKSGFTLIELLVVIAIIAILAAILFPVFAQARQAARGTSSQSNMRQMSIAIPMYAQDYDETFPQFQRWGDPNSPIKLGTTPFSMWSYDIQPYIKNTQIYADPLVGTITQAGVYWPYYTTYGYNYTTLAPYSGAFGSTPWVGVPATLALIDHPAETVMVSSKFTVAELGGIYYYGPGTILTMGGAEPPDCGDINAWCFSDWAPDGNYSALTEEAGLYTGGNSLRKAKNGNFAFCDGHVKFIQPAQAAQGSNWFKGIKAGNVHVTDKTKYMWQVR